MKKFLFLLIAFISFICFCRAQNRYVDSLISYIKVAPEDTHKLSVLNVIIEAINEDAVWSRYNDQLGPLSQKLMTSKDTAIQLKAKKHYSAFLNNKGYLSNNLGAVTQALDYFHQSLRIQEQIGDLGGQAYSLNNIGFIYSNQNQFTNALEYYQKSLAIQKKIGDREGEAQSLSNIGNVYDRTGSLKKALYYYFKGLNLRREIHNKHGIGYSLQNIGSVYFNQKSYFVALYYHTKSLEIRKLINDQQGVCYSLCNLGKIYLVENNLPIAMKTTEEALELAKKIGYPENISNAATLLEDIYLKDERFDKAHEMLKLSVQMRDSIVNDVTHKNTVKKQLQYEFEKKEVISRAEQEKRELTYQAKEKQQRIIMYAVVGGLIICFLFGAFMYNRFKVTQKQNVIIQSQKKLVEDQKHIVETHRKEILDSINYAKRIQYALLANEIQFKENLESHFILFKPKDIVSGDFYWATSGGSSEMGVRSSNTKSNYEPQTPNSKLTANSELFYLAVCDSTGHGVPGAFMSLLNIGFLSEAINEKKIAEPNEVLNYVRERLVNSISNEGQQDGFDGVILCIDKSKGTITYSAAYNAPILISTNLDGKPKIIELNKDKMPVGKGENQSSFTNYKIEAKKGDFIYLFTDGYADQFGGQHGKKFKYKQLEELLLAVSSLPLHEQKEFLDQKFETWKGDLEQVDDVLIVGIKV